MAGAPPFAPVPGAVEHKFGAGHAERIEDVLLLELVQRLSRDDLDDAAEHVGGVAVAPQRAGLARQRQSGNPFGKFLVVEMALKISASI